MSPRQNRRRPVDRPLAQGRATSGVPRTEQWADGEWNVQDVSGSAATKPYRCPGCDHEIRPGASHVVAWPVDGFGGVDDRRHWHRPCWRNRAHRRPRR